MPRSWVFPSSTHPPSLPVLDAATSRRSGSPEMVLLDTKAYITDDRRNGTTATACTRDGHVVKVSFWLAEPPTVSHLCVHCPDLKVTNFIVEPVVVCSEKNIAILLISFSFPPSNDPAELGFRDFFVYRAHPEHPSLDRLPTPPLRFLDPDEVGLLPCLGDGDDDFVLAALSSRLNPQEYDLHMYVSKTGRWSTKLALLEPPPPNSRDALLLHRTDKTITLEGGSMAWVDPWRGALLCNVFDENPVVRYIRFPRPADGNKDNSKEKCAQLYRDVTYSNNLLKFIEVELYKRPDIICQGPVQPDINVFSDEDYEDDLDTTATRTWYGWRASLWSRKASSTSWHRDFTVDVDEIVISDPTHSDLLPELTVQYPGKSTLQNLVTSSPILSNQGDDVVYLMSKVNFEDEKTWVIGVDMKTKALRGVASFSTERCVYSSPAYLPCSLSGYLDMTSKNYNSDADCNMKGRNDSMNVRSDTTIIVNGLDPCITEDDLRQVFELFGEVQYVKVLAHLQYASVEFIERPDAEDAILALNGALIGARNVRLSWGCNTLEQPPQHDVNQWNGNSYYDHSHCYGAQRYSSPTVEDPDVYAYGTSPSYSHYQQQPLAQQNISQWNGGNYHFYTQAYGRCQYCSPAIQNPNVYAHCTYPASYGNYQQQQQLPRVQHSYHQSNVSEKAKVNNHRWRQGDDQGS